MKLAIAALLRHLRMQRESRLHGPRPDDSVSTCEGCASPSSKRVGILFACSGAAVLVACIISQAFFAGQTARATLSTVESALSSADWSSANAARLAEHYAAASLVVSSGIQFIDRGARAKVTVVVEGRIKPCAVILERPTPSSEAASDGWQVQSIDC